MNCPGSVAAEAQYPKRASGQAARLGTSAHALSERCLREGKNADDFLGHQILLDKEDWATWRTPAQAKKRLPAGYDASDAFTVDDDMVGSVQTYIDYVRATIERLGGPRAVVGIEERFDLSWIRPGMFGTNDTSVEEPFGEIEIIDFKNGSGIAVEIENNSQTRYYAVGKIGKNGFDDYTKVTLTIVQPRKPHEDGPVRSETVTIDELRAFAVRLGEAADAARRPNAPRVPGKWCKFCEHSGACVELQEATMRSAGADFDDDVPEAVLPTVGELPKGKKGKALALAERAQTQDLDRLAKALKAVPMVLAWAKAVKGEAHRVMVNMGLPLDGFKVVGSWSNRAWSVEEKAVVRRLKKEGLTEAELYEEPKLLSPSKVEKLGKGLKPIVDQMTTRELKGVAVAPITARGTPIDPREVAALDFDDLPEED